MNLDSTIHSSIKLSIATRFIASHDYDHAIDILQSIDHPLAHQLLRNIDDIQRFLASGHYKRQMTAIAYEIVWDDLVPLFVRHGWEVVQQTETEITVQHHTKHEQRTVVASWIGHGEIVFHDGSQALSIAGMSDVEALATVSRNRLVSGMQGMLRGLSGWFGGARRAG